MMSRRVRLVVLALCAMAGCAGGDGEAPEVADAVSERSGGDGEDADAATREDGPTGQDATETTALDTPESDGTADASELPGAHPSGPFWTLTPVSEIVVEACATIQGLVSLKALLAPKGDDPGFATPEVPIQPGSPCIVLPGMVAETLNTLRLEARAEDGTLIDLGLRTFDAPPLPASLPRISATGTSTIEGWVALPLARKFAKDGGMAVIVDPRRGGRIIWYHAMGAVSDYGLLFQPLARGRFAEYRGPAGGTDIIDLRGNVLETWNNIPGWDLVDGHLGVFLEDGSAILNGHVGTCQVIARVSAARRIEFTYHTLCMNPEVGDTLGPHPNWAVLRPSGDLMVSLRNENAVDLYSGKDGTRIWRFGGNGSDFTLIGSDQTFSTQHGANLTPEGTLLVFDNGTDRDTPVSRILEYRLDEVAFTATLVREIEPAVATYTPVGGSAQRLPNGHTLAGRFFSVAEVDENGTEVWTLEAATPEGKPWFSYLAFPMDEVH